MRSITAALLATIVVAGCSSPAPDLVRRPKVVPPAVVIVNVAVFDPETGATTPDRDVLLTGDRITSITPAGSARAPANAFPINGGGATLVPGLIDMHGHVANSPAPPWLGEFPDPDRNLLAYLYCGVTTVLDPADLVTEAFVRRDRVTAGALLGPRIFASGPMVTAPGGHPIPVLEQLAPWWLRWYLIPRYVREADTPEAAREAVRELAGLGADVVKLAVDRVPADAPRIRREVVAAAGDEAKQRGIRTVAHIGTTEDAIDAADGGAALWVHHVYRERIPDEQISKLAAYGIPMVSTMAVFESYALMGQGPREAIVLERETVPAETLAGFDEIPESAVPSFRPFIETLRPLRAAWRENVRRLRDAGVTIYAGSDTQSGVFPGAGLHRELRLLTEAGLTPAEAIRAATSDPARFLANGKEPEIGTIAVGKRADLVLVDGDPSADVAAVSRIRVVIKDGVPLERRPLPSH